MTASRVRVASWSYRRSVDEDGLPRISPSLLRNAETMCPRRLFKEYEAERKASPLGDTNFEVPNRIMQEALLWHRGATEDDSSAIAFPTPTDLQPEQIALYEACARGYLNAFPSPAGEVGDIPFDTECADHGVVLIGPVGVPLTLPDGSRELRVLRVAKRGSLLDETDLQFAVLRAEDWAQGDFSIVAVDLLDLRSVEYTIELESRSQNAREWLHDRLAAIKARMNADGPIVGNDCSFCGFIPGCRPLARA